jgi:hypothetical protein
LGCQQRQLNVQAVVIEGMPEGLLGLADPVLDTVLVQDEALSAVALKLPFSCRKTWRVSRSLACWSSPSASDPSVSSTQARSSSTELAISASGATSVKLVSRGPDGPAASATACAPSACRWVRWKPATPAPAAPKANRILTFVWPGITLYVVSILVVWYLIIFGVMHLVGALAGPKVSYWWSQLLLGVAEPVLGVWAVRSWQRSLLTVVTLVGCGPSSPG